MSEGIGADLRAFLEEMYEKYGHNETTVAIRPNFRYFSG